jgi:hypothetical protein
MIGGSMSGILSYTLIYPLDLTKTMMSINRTPDNLSVFQSMNYLKNKYGYKSLYKGLGATYVVS